LAKLKKAFVLGPLWKKDLEILAFLKRNFNHKNDSISGKGLGRFACVGRGKSLFAYRKEPSKKKKKRVTEKLRFKFEQFASWTPP
jgi:hypothetical protein